MRRLHLGLALVLGGLASTACAEQAIYEFEVARDAGDRWYKGNTRAHTTESDGRDIAYIRAKVTDSGGRVAWTQPVFVTRR